MNPSAWRTLCLTSLSVILLISAAGGLLEQYIPHPTRSVAGWLVLGLLGAALFGFVFSVPPLAVRWFIERQQRLGNTMHPAVIYLVENERNVVAAIWAVWAVGALIAVPAAIHNWMTQH